MRLLKSLLMFLVILNLVQSSLKIISESDDLSEKTTNGDDLDNSPDTSKNFAKKIKTRTDRSIPVHRKLQNRRPRGRARRNPNREIGGGRRRRRTPVVARRNRRNRRRRTVSDRVLLRIYRVMLTRQFGHPDSGFVLQRPGTRCSLYAEFEPFFYTTVTRSVSTTIHFDSNCIRRTTINLETVFGRSRFVSWNYHPTRMFLNIFGNVYRLDYRRPRVIDRTNIMRSLRYTRARLRHASRRNQQLRLLRRNSMYLSPQIRGSYSQINVRRIRSRRGHWRCVTRRIRMQDFRGRVRRRRRIVTRMRRRGWTDREIARMIRRNQFDPPRGHRFRRRGPFHDVLNPQHHANLTLFDPPRDQQNRRRRRPARRARQERPQGDQPVRPRNLEASDYSKTDESAFQTKDSSNPDRNARVIIPPLIPEQRAPNGIQNPTGSLRRTRDLQGRGRRIGRRRRRRRRNLRDRRSPFEIEEERQRQAERRLILGRLRRNFIRRLVLVCNLR